MSDTHADARPAPEGLVEAFMLPESVREEHPDLGILFDEMVMNLRAEAMGIPMTTMQNLLIERIATKYVFIKLRERSGWIGTNAEKDANDQWLNYVKEWNRLLAAGHEALRESLLKQMEKIALDAVKLVPGTDDVAIELRQLLRRHFQEQFAAMGL